MDWWYLQQNLEHVADHGTDLLVLVDVELGGQIDVFLANVDQFGVLIVPHADRDIDGLFLLILP
jgi:hypothetical protein